ncbi:phospholipase D-like protein [Sinobaca qinghaiensis]|uniref:Phospholipase D-like protein n=1 Tax=Sinobaca qinghaiensis TaxID=342944 RepID=A0A419V5A3_9BACL|nr:PLD nuclease N-terminal domain-containing protein [Sinobaca qinghaiensis]RKD75139.1 phospholipase D-like protein [Sinobaca qinghaiensis]
MTTDLFYLLLPILVIDLLLKGTALIDLYRGPQESGQKWIWAFVIIFVSTFGPIIYFLFGRSKGVSSHD